MPSPGPKELKKAMEYARKAKQIDKESVEAWKLLLKAAVISGNDREFNKILQSARRQFPDSPDIDTEVVEYMMVNREYQAAETTLRRIIGQHREFAPAYQALANLYVQKRQWTEAVENAYNALGFAPYDLRTWRLVGIALARNEEFNHAMGWLYKVISADSDDLLVATELARSLRKLHEFDAAYDIYQQVLAELGDRPAPSILQDFGLLLIEMERNTEAVEVLRRSHALAKEDVTLQMSLALALTNAGEFQEARDIYLSLIKKHPGVGEAYLYYTSITKMKEEAGFAEKILENIDQALDPKQEEAMYYAVSKTYEDQQNYTAAFENLNRACSLHKARCGYNEAANLAGFELIKKIFTRDFLDRFRDCGDPSPRPVFVLGMPRSGTTLVEQILSSHPQVVGGGELLFMDMMLRNHAAMTESQMVGSLAHLICEATHELAEGYLSLLAHIGREDQMVVDKMPHNFMHIGLISILFPNAKIIHVKRDPMAICLSCYKQRFNEGHTYSFDLGDLGRYYLAHLDLMEHWYQLLPERIFPVEYEKLTGGFEQQVREMIDYCGLEWDDACLSFHKNRRAVRTASLAQIRKPIYTDSVSFWRNYEEQLQPLSDILRAGGAI